MRTAEEFLNEVMAQGIKCPGEEHCMQGALVNGHGTLDNYLKCVGKVVRHLVYDRLDSTTPYFDPGTGKANLYWKRWYNTVEEQYKDVPRHFRFHLASDLDELRAMVKHKFKDVLEFAATKPNPYAKVK